MLMNFLCSISDKREWSGQRAGVISQSGLSLLHEDASLDPQNGAGGAHLPLLPA